MFDSIEFLCKAFTLLVLSVRKEAAPRRPRPAYNPMKKNARTGSRLFFIEFLIVIFFFLIISTVCLRLFVAARLTTQKASALSHAQQISSSIAELVEGGVNRADELPEYFPDDVYEVAPDSAAEGTAAISDKSDSTTASADASARTSVAFYYDREFTPCSKGSAFCTVTASLTISGSQKQVTIVTKDIDGTVIYELPVTFHVPAAKKETIGS